MSRPANNLNASVEVLEDERTSLTAEEFKKLYRENQSLVRSVLFQISGPESHDAIDDLVQEAFIRVWKGLSGFRHDARITSWIYRVTVNTALDHLRSRKRRAETREEAIETKGAEVATSQPGPEKDVSNREIVQKGLMCLSDEHRTVLVLAFLHELPIAEVAEVLGISEGTVKSRLHYAKAEFRDYLAGKGVEPNE